MSPKSIRTSRPPLDTLNPRQVVVFAPNWLGDVVMCTPAIRTIAQRFPHAHLTVVGKPSNCKLLEGLPSIQEFCPIPAKAGLLSMLRLANRFRGRPKDLAIVFPHSTRAALTARVAGCKRVLGYDRGGRARLLTDALEPHKVDGVTTPKYMAWEYLDLLDPLGCEYDGFGLELVADAHAVARMKEHLVGERPYVGIAPGAAFGPSKLWPSERFAAVADALHEQMGASCVLLTGPGEEAIRDAVQAAAKHPLIECDERNPTMDSLKATMSLLDLFVGNDSGPRHVAVAFNVPTVILMGPTSPLYSEGPYERGRVLRVDVDCGPCHKPICATDHRCLTRIHENDVIEAAKDVLRKARV